MSKPRGFVVVLIIIMVFFVIWKLQSNTPTSNLDDTALAQLSLTDELATRFTTVNSSLDIHQRPDKTVWWNTAEGYSIRMNATESIQAAKANVKIVAQNDVVDTYFLPEITIVHNTFMRRGFTLDTDNSSRTTADERFFDYVQAYQKGDTLCTTVVNPEYSSYDGGGTDMAYTLTVSCADTLTQEAEGQQPLLDALDLRAKDATAYIGNQVGDFFVVQVNYRRGGTRAVLKKEGATYRVLLVSQEEPPCKLLDEEKVPPEVRTIIGGGCFDENGTFREPSI